MQLISPPDPGSATWRLIGAVVAGAFRGGEVAAAGGGTTIAKDEVITGDGAAPPSTVIIVVIVAVALRAARYAWAILLEDPHVEGQTLSYLKWRVHLLRRSRARANDYHQRSGTRCRRP